MIKTLIDSVVTSISVRIDGIVKDVDQLKASLDFSQKDLTDHAEKIKSIEDNVSKIKTTKKHIKKTVYLEDETICALKDFWKMTMKHGMKWKWKL